MLSRSAYAVTNVDQNARSLTFEASGGLWAWAQVVSVSITGLGDEETLVNATVAAKGLATFTEGGRQKALLKEFFSQLERELRG